MKTVLVLWAWAMLVCGGCAPGPSFSADLLCGQWQMYGADTGRNGPEVRNPVTFTFFPDGSYLCRITDSEVEETKGTWNLDGDKVTITDARKNSAVYVYREDRGHTLRHRAFHREFFPRGVTVILRKE